MSIHGNMNLPITKEYLNELLRRHRFLLLEVKWGERETDLSPQEVDRTIGQLDRMIHDLGVDRAPRLLGHRR